MSSFRPTTAILPDLIATACQIVNWESTLTILPLWRMRSASAPASSGTKLERTITKRNINSCISDGLHAGYYDVLGLKGCGGVDSNDLLQRPQLAVYSSTTSLPKSSGRECGVANQNFYALDTRR